jgi:hypothetical protein
VPNHGIPAPGKEACAMSVIFPDSFARHPWPMNLANRLITKSGRENRAV